MRKHEEDTLQIISSTPDRLNSGKISGDELDEVFGRLLRWLNAIA